MSERGVEKEKAFPREGTRVIRVLVSLDVAEKAVHLGPENGEIVKIAAREGDEYVVKSDQIERVKVVPQGKVLIQREPVSGHYLYDDKDFWKVVMRRGRDDQELARDITQWHQHIEWGRERTHQKAEEIRTLRHKLAEEMKGLKPLARILFGTTRKNQIRELKRRLRQSEWSFGVSIKYRKKSVRTERKNHYSGVFLPKSPDNEQ